ncbi:hypothetical protein PFLUOLIPICF7_22005 [Pseudomonas simiae]|nr:hypothetical protein PFLUOLIPICF7_22005 [Pseudomonas simiae]
MGEGLGIAMGMTDYRVRLLGGGAQKSRPRSQQRLAGIGGRQELGQVRQGACAQL